MGSKASTRAFTDELCEAWRVAADVCADIQGDESGLDEPPDRRGRVPLEGTRVVDAAVDEFIEVKLIGDAVYGGSDDPAASSRLVPDPTPGEQAV